MTLTNKTKNLIKLILSCTLVVCGIALIVVASVLGAIRYKGIDYSHNITIENVRTDATSSEIVYHYVSLSGSVRNCTDKDLEKLPIRIVFDGVDNNTGEKNEYSVDVLLAGAKSNQSVMIKEEEIKIGNKQGFVPQSIKRVEFVLEDGKGYKAVYMPESDGNIIMFAFGFIAVALGGLLFANWFKEYKKLKEENKQK